MTRLIYLENHLAKSSWWKEFTHFRKEVNGEKRENLLPLKKEALLNEG
jgi:hypothetical protein